MKNNLEKSDFLIYTSSDGKTKLQVNIENETIWLNQEQIALLYGKSRTTITGHIKNIFVEQELEKKVVCREFQHTTNHGAIKGKLQTSSTNYYNLDMILSVGYRVRSTEGTQFRKWGPGKLICNNLRNQIIFFEV